MIQNPKLEQTRSTKYKCKNSTRKRTFFTKDCLQLSPRSAKSYRKLLMEVWLLEHFKTFKNPADSLKTLWLPSCQGICGDRNISSFSSDCKFVGIVYLCLRGFNNSHFSDGAVVYYVLCWHLGFFKEPPPESINTLISVMWIEIKS